MENYQYVFMFSKKSSKIIIELLKEYEKINPPAEDESILSEYMKDEIEGQYFDKIRNMKKFGIWNFTKNR